MLAKGGMWRDYPLDEIREPGKSFSTSLGRALAGEKEVFAPSFSTDFFVCIFFSGFWRGAFFYVFETSFEDNS